VTATGELRDALDALGRGTCEVLVWRLRDGVPLDEAAARLGIDRQRAGRLLVTAARRLAPLYGATPGDYGWLHACRADLQSLPALRDPPAAPSGRHPRRHWLAAVGVAAMGIGVAVLSWSLWNARAPVGLADELAAEAADERPDAAAALVSALPDEDAQAPPLAAADLPLLASAGDDHALLDDFELLAWIAEHHLPADAAAPASPPLPPQALQQAPPPTWAQMPPEQRALLASWERHWERLGADQRRQLAANAQLWNALTPEQQGQLRARLQQWRALDPAERARLRLRHESFARLGAIAQVRLRAALAHLQAQTAQAGEVLRTQFAALPATQRQAYLLGSDEREIAALAQRVFAYVPTGERTATLSMLEELGGEERALLQRLAARMAPWQRDELRQTLLARAPRERAAYLRSLPAR